MTLEDTPEAPRDLLRLLDELRAHDVVLAADGERLHCTAPPGVLQPALRARLAAHKRELLAFLQAAASARQDADAVVPLQPQGSRTPIFGIPGHNGDVFCYRALADRLGEDQPFFGLQPPGLDGRSAPLDSVPALVRHFAAQIAATRPQGPLILVGYCAGGTLAFALASHLQASGRPVAFVALFGSHFPHWYRWPAQLRHHLRRQGRRLAHHAAALWQHRAGMVAYLRGEWADRRRRLAGEQPSGPADPRRPWRRRVEAATMGAICRYTPTFFPGRLCLILPNPGWRYAVDAWLGWPPRMAARVEEYVGPLDGNGDTMLRPGQVARFAPLFLACRDAAP